MPVGCGAGRPTAHCSSSDERIGKHGPPSSSLLNQQPADLTLLRLPVTAPLLSHLFRTNQAWGPIYRLVRTPILTPHLHTPASTHSHPFRQVVLDKAGADVRFACSVARRLISLGAIQHGDQRSNLRTLNLKEFNLESKYGDR